MIQGRFIGHIVRTGAIRILTEEGLREVISFNRMTESDRWKPDDIPTLKGTPWEPQPKEAKELDLPAAAGEESAEPIIATEISRKTKDQAKYVDFYVTQPDLDRFGKTDACPACLGIHLHGRSTVPHSPDCRSRILDELSQTPEGKVRIEGWKMRRGERGDKRTREESTAAEAEMATDQPPIETPDELEDLQDQPRADTETRRVRQEPASSSGIKRTAEDQPGLPKAKLKSKTPQGAKLSLIHI